MGIETTPAFAIDRTFSVLWYDSIHPGLQVFEYAWIGILVDCETGAGVQASEMQHPCFDGRFGDQVVQAFVESCKPRAVGWHLKLAKVLFQGHGAVDRRWFSFTISKNLFEKLSCIVECVYVA